MAGTKPTQPETQIDTITCPQCGALTLFSHIRETCQGEPIRDMMELHCGACGFHLCGENEG